jgi:hypothetical protein
VTKLLVSLERFALAHAKAITAFVAPLVVGAAGRYGLNLTVDQVAAAIAAVTGLLVHLVPNTPTSTTQKGA